MDAKKLISDLVAAGRTQAEIGRVIGLSQPAISDILTGKTKNVRWDVGQRLLEYHSEQSKGAPQEAV